jgi:hypothetical protein
LGLGNRGFAAGFRETGEKSARWRFDTAGISCDAAPGWGLAARVDGFHPSLGYYFIGGLHLILVTVAAAVASKHVYQIKRRA